MSFPSLNVINKNLLNVSAHLVQYQIILTSLLREIKHKTGKEIDIGFPSPKIVNNSFTEK